MLNWRDFTPLTIELLAKTAKNAGLRLEELYERLTAQGFNLEGIKEEVGITWHSEKGSKKLFEHLKKVFELSNINENERYVLANLSILPSVLIPKSDVKEWLSLESLEDVNALSCKGWLREAGLNVLMHQVVQEVARREMQPDIGMCESLVVWLAGVLHYEPHENPLDRKSYVVFAESVLKYLGHTDDSAIALLSNNVSMIYQAMGDMGKALECQKKALEIREKVLDKNHPDLAALYNNLSGIYKDMGDIKKALEYQKKALEIRKKVFDKNHPDLAQSYNNASMIYRDMGDREKALEYQKKALVIRKKVLDKNHPSLAGSYNNLSMIYQDLGEMRKALEYQKKALEVNEKILDSNHPNLASSYNNLSSIYKAMGDMEKAFEYQNKALEIREKVLDKNHPDLAVLS